jgi:hypothetical protein
VPLNTVVDRDALGVVGLGLSSARALKAIGKVYAARFSATLAEINAGKDILPVKGGGQITVLGVSIVVTGAFATLTDVRISDKTSGPVDVVTWAQANLTNGAKLNEMSANSSLGTGFNAPLAAPNGLQIRKTGSTGTGGTSISGVVLFTMV